MQGRSCYWIAMKFGRVISDSMPMRTLNSFLYCFIFAFFPWLFTHKEIFTLWTRTMARSAS